MALARARSIAVCLGALGLALASCQQLTLCEGSSCDAQWLVAGGSESDPPRSEGGAEAGATMSVVGGMSSAGAATDVAGAAGAAGAGQTGAAGEPAVPLCEAGTADCDGSRLTGCETQTGWTVRSCGQCGVSCEDGCYVGACLPSLLLGVDYSVLDFVKTNTYAFGLLSKVQEEAVTLTGVDLADGELHELLPSVSYYARLALGDRLYLFDTDPFAEPPIEPTIRSMQLDGSDQRIEDVSLPQDIGAYSGGAYYIGLSSGPESEDIYTLYYRGSVNDAWQAIRDDAHGSIWSSSVSGVVYVETDADDVEQLYLLHGATLVPFGPAPEDADQVLATPNGLAITTIDSDDNESLWWIRSAEARTSYPLPADATDMTPFGDFIAFERSEGKTKYVQPFSDEGPTTTRIGVRLGSELLAIDDRYLWHLVTDDWFHFRLLRTEWNAFGF